MKLKIGDSYKEEFVITQEMVNKFAELSGDKSLHLDKEFGQARFKTNCADYFRHIFWKGNEQNFRVMVLYT